MKKILILFAHPRFEQSRAQQTLVNAIKNLDEVTFCDLYELYPDYNIDIHKEQSIAKSHDFIVLQHPLYWYSSPPLLKQWLDMVLEFGWAYGPGGDALQGKFCFNVFSSGGARDVYGPDGRNRFTIAEYFRPFEQTARLCGMTYLPPFGIHGTHRLDDQSLHDLGQLYKHFLIGLANESIHPNAILHHAYANDFLSTQKLQLP